MISVALTAALAAAPPSLVSSNITRADYAGSAACEACHKDIYARWKASPMHRMTRDLPSVEVRAPFDGGDFAFKGEHVHFERVGRDRYMTQLAGADRRTYRVTRVIGGRYREDFAGLEVTAAKPAATVIGDPTQELVLPVSYVFASHGFRHKGYSVMNPVRPGLKAGPVWNQSCIDCHNTVPYLSVALGALHGPGAPGFQGEVVDALLPAGRRSRFAVTDPAGLQAAVDLEVAALGGTPGDLRSAIETTRDRLTGQHLIEVGIGCESCHGGSREHVANPNLLPSYEPRAPFLTVDPPGDRPIDRTCARCHQVLFSRYAYTWEGGTRTKGPGGSTINSGEARDALLSKCQVKCTACHDPHQEDSAARLAALPNGVCTGCHATYASAKAVQAHAHHDPAKAGGSCIGCHMPRKNMGLGYGLTRYHRIGSPDDVARVEKDRPLECALCHADKSVAILVASMETWWGKRYDRQALTLLYGELSAQPLRATLRRGKPHEQAVALGVLRDHDALPEIAGQLTHRYPLVRYYARKALEEITSSTVAIDLDQDDAAIEKDAAHWLSAR